MVYSWHCYLNFVRSMDWWQQQYQHKYINITIILDYSFFTFYFAPFAIYIHKIQFEKRHILPICIYSHIETCTHRDRKRERQRVNENEYLLVFSSTKQ